MENDQLKRRGLNEFEIILARMLANARVDRLDGIKRRFLIEKAAHDITMDLLVDEAVRSIRASTDARRPASAETARGDEYEQE